MNKRSSTEYGGRAAAIRTTLATVLSVLAMGAAQAQFGGGAPAYTPEPDARDLKAVLFNWAWHMGMLRGQAEPELVGTLEYEASGTVQIDGETCAISRYRVSANYQLPGFRTQIECTLPNGSVYSNVETMSGPYAWDEDMPGAEIVPGEGTAVPNQDARTQRRIRLWASPHGAAKAAIAAATGLPTSASFGENPAALLDRQSAAGIVSDTTLSWNGDRPVLTFPLPDVPGALATATLGPDFLPERVVVEHQGSTYEFEYGGFADFNNPLHRIEALYAGTIVEKHDGATVRTLQTLETEVGQVYVAVPVPESIGTVNAQAQPYGDPATPSQAPTPRLSNGRPDLSGSWRGAAGGPRRVPGGMFRRCSPFQDNCMEWTNQSADFVFMASSRLDPNQPLYKPEHWDRVQELDQWTNRYDPVMTCLPLGMPRHGPPVRIFQTADDITMFYRGGIDGGGGYPDFRMISMHKNEHDEDDVYGYSYMGRTATRWEGDTLVLDSIGFTDETWLGRGGFFHSTDMRVIERFTRTGDQLLYEVTVEDPEVLVEPWVAHPRTLQLSDQPTLIAERGSCTDTELAEVTTQIRH